MGYKMQSITDPRNAARYQLALRAADQAARYRSMDGEKWRELGTLLGDLVTDVLVSLSVTCHDYTPEEFTRDTARWIFPDDTATADGDRGDGGAASRHAFSGAA